MKAAFLLAVFSSCLCLVAHGNLVNFADMIKKVTGKNAIPDYTTYGCYCGLGGRGQPVDATDRCCRSHDCCYIKLEARGCKPKTDSYRFSMSGGNVACDLDAEDDKRNMVLDVEDKLILNVSDTACKGKGECWMMIGGVGITIYVDSGSPYTIVNEEIWRQRLVGKIGEFLLESDEAQKVLVENKN
ncbi:hypothetical protein NDU88_008852 [Pleurodeles waltl]|uniref:Phospholipase A2 n=1 Tax=Pleurodeles waltl TaxID=8319 RepID=A0AAV7QQZ0_PLEWA|nr:hypothetical protein NDU88_008852 [Pleurodeles waltl]